MPKGSETADLVWPFIDAVNELPCARAYRLHSGKTRVKGGWMKNNPEGTPDVFVLAAGVPMFFEAKKPDGKTDKRRWLLQKRAADDARAAGGRAMFYTNVRDAVSEVTAVLRQKGAIR